MKLLISAASKYLLGFAAMSLLLFPAAGDWGWADGWLFMSLLFGPMLVMMFVLWYKAPELLEKRLRSKEEQKEQKGIVAFAGLVFLLVFPLAALDHRFGWSAMPQWLVFAAAFIQLASYALYAEVMRENAWLSRTVELQEGQKVVDTGLYALVRHPMYSATILLFVSVPLVLGSWYAFVLMLFYPILIIIRLLSEETFLEKELEGYAEYKARVRWRLFPGLW